MVMFMPRISKYEEWEKNNEINEKLILIEGWSRDGLSQQQIANNLGINVDTLIEYKKKYSDFSEALKKGREVVDFEIENALYKSAMEGNVTAQIYWLKCRKKEKWGEEKEQENSNKTKITIINSLPKDDE